MSRGTLHKHCLQCDYILDGLSEFRCPECSRAFDPNDPKTYRDPSHEGPRSALSSCIAVIAGAHLIPLSISTCDVGFRVPGEFYPLGGTGLDNLGMVLAATSPVILILCAITRRRRLLWVGGIEVLLGVIWGLSAFRLLHYL